jgi:hypothetical protein
MEFALWQKQRVNNIVRLVNVDNGENFATYTLDTDGKVKYWEVSIDDEEVISGKPHMLEDDTDIRQKILEVVAQKGPDLRGKSQYVLSVFEGAIHEHGRYILQKFVAFGEIGETYIITLEKEKVVVANLNKQTFSEYAQAYPSPTKFAMEFLAGAIKLKDQQDEVYYTARQVAQKIGMDERKLGVYWRRGTLPFPAKFSGGEEPVWNEEKKKFMGGGTPLWSETQVKKMLEK